MSVEFNGVGHALETIALPADGKVTGTINVVWLAGGRATVESGTVTFRGRDFTLSYARFELSGDEWEFVKENMTVPVRNAEGTYASPVAAPTFRDAVLAACSEALKAAWTVEKSRAAGRSSAERDVERADAEIAELHEKLVAARKEKADALARLALYTD